MTINELLNRVPWGQMRLGRDGLIRRAGTDECPICAALGKTDNEKAAAYAMKRGVPLYEASDVMDAADYASPYTERSKKLRSKMLRRIREARS